MNIQTTWKSEEVFLEFIFNCQNIQKQIKSMDVSTASAKSGQEDNSYNKDS